MIKKSLVFILVLLCSCASTPNIRSINDEKFLENLNNWYFNSKIGFKSGIISIPSINLVWTHSFSRDKLLISGPFGLGSVTARITNGKRAIVGRSFRNSMIISDINAYLKNKYEIDILINDLKYWVIGIPNPDMLFYWKKDKLYQNSWEIHYLEFENYKGINMPTKIIMSNGELSIKFIIDEWIF